MTSAPGDWGRRTPAARETRPGDREAGGAPKRVVSLRPDKESTARILRNGDATIRRGPDRAQDSCGRSMCKSQAPRYSSSARACTHQRVALISLHRLKPLAQLDGKEGRESLREARGVVHLVHVQRLFEPALDVGTPQEVSLHRSLSEKFSHAFVAGPGEGISIVRADREHMIALVI